MSEIIYQFGDEILKKIDGFENYAVSNKGYVYKGLKYGLLPEKYKEFRIKPFKNKQGFLQVQLSNKGKRKVLYVHRLVAQYFVPNPENYKYVVHIDGNRENNKVSNLKWSPYPEKKEMDYQEIFDLYAQGYSIYKISKQTGLSPQKIMKILGKKDILSISVSSELKEKLVQEAKEKGITLNKLIEEILNKYIGEKNG
ncbi:HNH endonuclease [Persephonella sp.]|uniref:HNH endonuclease n=1 Tax=Persephonella sp. TaxID=2060922 RepID=UPI00262B89B8|nr:HNH endonuclease [Persephonella sp.]